jgi:hypothetical protein
LENRKYTELQRKFNEAAEIRERLDEQFITLSSNKENVDIPSSTRTIDKTIFKHIPVIVNTRVIANNGGNIKSLSTAEPSRIANTNIHKTMFVGPNEANKRKRIVIGDSHSRGLVRNVSDYLDGRYVVTGMIKPGAWGS